MSKVEVILKKPLKGKKTGDSVTMSWAHAKALIAIGHAEKAGEPAGGKNPAPKKPTAKTTARKPAAKKPAQKPTPAKPQTE